MLQLYRSALRLRRTNPGLHGEDFHWLDSPAGTLLFERGNGVLCAVNLSDQPMMRICEFGQGYSSPHSLRSSTEWGVSTSTARVVGRGRPLVECAGRAEPSRTPSAALRAGLRPSWTARPAPGPGWLSGGPSLVAPVRRSSAVWVGRSIEQVWGQPRSGGGQIQRSSSPSHSPTQPPRCWPSAP